jgi:hypothetical protein
MEVSMSYSQLLHLGACGRSPRKGEPAWSCISGVTAEAARVPSASRHIRYPSEPRILHGGSPLEAGRLATERADQAYDHGRRRRRLRRDGVALLAGVVSYPVPRKAVDEDPLDQDIYGLWLTMTLAWLQLQFGIHLHCVVEHADEEYLHIHFYVVPDLLPNLRLNLNDIHPGRLMKTDAAAAGASERDQESAYRSGMSRWLDDYWYAVSRTFGHHRFGPKRRRVSRMQRQMEKRLEEAKARQDAGFERQQAVARGELERERAQQATELHQAYARPYQDLQQRHARLAELRAADNQAAAAAIAALRMRLAEYEPEVVTRLVV